MCSPRLSAESERSGERLCAFVSVEHDAEVAVTAQLRIGAGSADDRERTSLSQPAGDATRELRMEQDREGAAVVGPLKRLAHGQRVVEDATVREGTAAADKFVDERARRAKRAGCRERPEPFPFRWEGEVRDDRGILRGQGRRRPRAQRIPEQ